MVFTSFFHIFRHLNITKNLYINFWLETNLKISQVGIKEKKKKSSKQIFENSFLCKMVFFYKNGKKVWKWKFQICFLQIFSFFLVQLG